LQFDNKIMIDDVKNIFMTKSAFIFFYLYLT
jgi:hypothetical protein